MLKTWSEVESWDDVVAFGTEKVFSQLSRTIDPDNCCEYMGRRDNIFFYCKARARNSVAEGLFKFAERPHFNSAEYQAQVDYAFLQLFCVDKDDCQKCVTYKKTQKREVKI